MKAKWIIIGLLAAFGLMFIMGMFFVHMMKNLKGNQHVTVHSDSWLLLELGGDMVEYNRYEDDFFLRDQFPAVHDVEQAIYTASRDRNIQGIVLSPRLGAISGVNLQRIGQALEEFKATGKPVEAWLTSGSQKDYWLATFADHIHMLPSESASLVFTGVGGSSLFYTDTMAKLGIKMHVFQVGDSKGAGEMFERTSYSPAFRRNLDRVLGAYYENMLQDLANRRFGGDVAPVRRLYEERQSLFVTPSQAMEWGLVDALEYPEDFLISLNITEDQLVEWADYDPETFSSSRDRIAVVYAQGAITFQENGPFAANSVTYKGMDEVLDEIEDDPHVQAVVLRVDSPGGSALVSEQIHQRLQRLQRRIPVVVSMAGVAASGGYYISCGADSIFAEPFTITGSIGVISMFPNMSELGEKIELHTDRVSRGKFAGVFQMWDPLNEDLAVSLRAHGQSVYNEFKTRVAQGRHMSMDQVQEIAQGKIYTGQQAVDVGLVDAVGTLDDALDSAARLAGLTQYTVVPYPRKKSILQEMLQEGFGMRARMALSGGSSLPAELQTCLQLLQNEQVLMLSPVASDANWGSSLDLTVPQNLLD